MAEDDKETTGTLDATIEEIGPCKKRLSIQVSAERVTEEIDKQFEEVIRTYQFKGFRRGKAPRLLVERQLGEPIRAEVMQNLVLDTFQEALDEHGLELLGEPHTDFDGAIERGKPFEFRVTFEVRPEFEVPDLSEVEVEREVAPVTDEAIDGALERLARSRATYEDADDDELRPEDLVLARVRLGQKGETVLQKDEYSFVPGEKRIFGLAVDDLPERIESASKGDELEFEIEIPQYLAGKRLAAGPAELTVEPFRVQRMRMPAIDDELARAFDFDDLDALREDIRKDLQQEAAREADREVENRILDALLERVSFEIPESVLERELDATLERQRIRLQLEGKPMLEIEESLDLARGRQRDEVVAMLRKGFLLDSIARAQRIYVTEEMVEATMQVLAGQEGRPIEEVRRYFEEGDRLRRLRTELRERLTREALRKRAKITDK